MTTAPGSGSAADVDRSDPAGRAWVDRAVAAVEADARRSADTHLLVYPLPPEWGVDLYLKDESTHPTGSLKHRLARSLFLYALCSGQITEGSTVVEASSGSTASIVVPGGARAAMESGAVQSSYCPRIGRGGVKRSASAGEGVQVRSVISRYTALFSIIEESVCGS